MRDERSSAPGEYPKGIWSTPVTIEAQGARRAVARYPSLAVGAAASESYIVGNDIQFFDLNPVPDNPLSVWSLGGRELGHPPGRFAYVFPKATVTGDQLLLFWAEPSGAPQRIEALRWPPTPLTSVWSAIYDPQSGWSQPVRVFNSTGIQWDNSTTSSVVRFGQNEFLQSFLILDSNRPLPSAITILKGSGNNWTPIIPELAEIPLSTSIATDGERIVLANIGTDFARNQLNAVFVRESADGGKSWTPRQVLTDVGLGPVTEMRLLRSTDGWYHIVWLQGDFQGPSVLVHRATSDGGKTWTAHDTLRPPVGVRGLRGVADNCGAVHVVYDDWAGGGTDGHVDHAVWRNGWSQPQHLFPNLRSAGADISVSPDGQLVMAFLAQGSDAPLTATNATRVAFLKP